MFDVSVHTGSRISHGIHRLTLKMLNDKNCIFELGTFEDMFYNMKELIQKECFITFKMGKCPLYIYIYNQIYLWDNIKRKICITNRLYYQNHY